MQHESDNPAIGLILYQDKNRVLAEYALRGLDKPIGISEYGGISGTRNLREVVDRVD